MTRFEQAQALRAQGKTYREIAHRLKLKSFGCAWNYVHRNYTMAWKRERYHQTKAPDTGRLRRVDLGMAWWAEANRENRLREMRQGKPPKSYRECARLLNTTIGTVSGKCRRLGI
jgi:DNA-binding CsgD family transcriptional regulator